MVELTVAPTTRVPTLKVMVIAPAGTVTFAGRITGSLPVSVTTAPPEGAALPRVTVPVTSLPPTTLGGLSEIESVAGVLVTVIVEDLLLAPKVAVIVAVPGATPVTGNGPLE